MEKESLTLEQQATNYATMRHIEKVKEFIHKVIINLLKRTEQHDQTKLAHPEVETFTEYTPKLGTSTYGSEEYNSFLEAMKPALAHHYGHNRHHPEHYKSGIDEMNLIDLMEMFCDWKASSMRHADGNIRKSIEINSKRFSMSPQLVKILENTADYMDRV
jgi:hypothetical protein